MAHANKKVDIAFKKAASHLGKVGDLLSKNAYCIDIVQQNLAVIGLLKSVNERLLENHLYTCFDCAVESVSAHKKEEMVGELLKVLRSAQKK